MCGASPSVWGRARLPDCACPAVRAGAGSRARLPLLGIGTLEAMALASGGERVIVALDARMGEVYYGLSCIAACWAKSSFDAPSLCRWNRPVGSPAATACLPTPYCAEQLAAVVDVWRPEIMPSAEAVVRLAAPDWSVVSRSIRPTRRRFTCATRSRRPSPNVWRSEAGLTRACSRRRQVDPADERPGDVDEILRIDTRSSHPWSRANFADSIASGYQLLGVSRRRRAGGYYVVMMAVDRRICQHQRR